MKWDIQEEYKQVRVNPTAIKILVFTNEPELASFYTDAFESEQFSVEAVTSIEQAERQMGEKYFHWIFIDLSLPLDEKVQLVKRLYDSTRGSLLIVCAYIGSMAAFNRLRELRDECRKHLIVFLHVFKHDRSYGYDHKVSKKEKGFDVELTAYDVHLGIVDSLASAWATGFPSIDYSEMTDIRQSYLDQYNSQLGNTQTCVSVERMSRLREMYSRSSHYDPYKNETFEKIELAIEQNKLSRVNKLLKKMPVEYNLLLNFQMAAWS